MFEQALLSTGQQLEKRRAVAAAFTGQAVAVGALIVASMFYAEKLVPPHIVYIVAPALMHEPPPVQTRTARTTTAATSVLSPPAASTLWHAPVATAPRFVADPGPPDLTPPTTLVSGGGSGRVPSTGVGLDTAALLDAPPPAAPPAVKKETGPIRVSSGVAQAMLVHKVLPVYPALAKQMRLSGEVRLQGIIGRDGTIQKLEVLSGHSLLIEAAIQAVKQWVYRPTLLNGQAVEVIAPIQVRFVLGS